MSQFFFQRKLLKSDSSPDASSSGPLIGIVELKHFFNFEATRFTRQVRSKLRQLRNTNFTSSQRHEWMASSRFRLEEQQAAAKNNNLETGCNVQAAASQVESVELNRAVINRNILIPVPPSNMLAVVPSRKAIFVSHLASTMTPEMIKERVQLGLPGVDPFLDHIHEMSLVQTRIFMELLSSVAYPLLILDGCDALQNQLDGIKKQGIIASVQLIDYKTRIGEAAITSDDFSQF
uniref:Uncharacterized protein n=1 Tax=Glossina pallidipes TaxID=7398 RepID=A0A1A9Z7Q7_GLOPL